MKLFDEIKNHSSYKSLPSKVQNILRVALQDENSDLLAALISVVPKAEGVSRDIQLDTLRKILTLPTVQTLLAFLVFGIDLGSMEGSPELPNGLGRLL